MSNVRNNTLASSNNEYFDLLDYTHDITEAYVAAQVAQSTAWRIDNMIVSESRQVFKHVREHLFTQGVDGYAELTAALHEAQFAEQSFLEAGLDKEGAVENIRALNAQRDQWHDLAATLTSMTLDYRGMPRTFEVRSLEDAFFREQNMRVSTDTQRRLRMSATRMAEAYGMADQAEALLERKLDRQKTQLGRIAENMKQQAGAVHLMFHQALRSDDEGAALRGKAFWQLPIECQRTLLDNAIKAAERADEYAAGERSMTDSEYDRILLCVMKTVKDLRTVMKAPRFVVPMQQREAAEG